VDFSRAVTFRALAVRIVPERVSRPAGVAAHAATPTESHQASQTIAHSSHAAANTCAAHTCPTFTRRYASSAAYGTRRPDPPHRTAPREASQHASPADSPPPHRIRLTRNNARACNSRTPSPKHCAAPARRMFHPHATLAREHPHAPAQRPIRIYQAVSRIDAITAPAQARHIWLVRCKRAQASPHAPSVPV
jgi:hypothetical protein